MNDLQNKFSRKIEYEGNFRSGYIIYSDTDHVIKFYHEMGGGNCMFYIDIPTINTWERETKMPLYKRDEILEFVANTVQKQQASNCTYVMQESSIIFYYKK